MTTPPSPPSRPSSPHHHLNNDEYFSRSDAGMGFRVDFWHDLYLHPIRPVRSQARGERPRGPQAEMDEIVVLSPRLKSEWPCLSPVRLLQPETRDGDLLVVLHIDRSFVVTAPSPSSPRVSHYFVLLDGPPAGGVSPLALSVTHRFALIYMNGKICIQIIIVVVRLFFVFKESSLNQCLPSAPTSILTRTT